MLEGKPIIIPRQKGPSTFWPIRARCFNFQSGARKCGSVRTPLLQRLSACLHIYICHPHVYMHNRHYRHNMDHHPSCETHPSDENRRSGRASYNFSFFNFSFSNFFFFESSAFEIRGEWVRKALCFRASSCWFFRSLPSWCFHLWLNNRVTFNASLLSYISFGADLQRGLIQSKLFPRGGPCGVPPFVDSCTWILLIHVQKVGLFLSFFGCDFFYFLSFTKWWRWFSIKGKKNDD